MNKPQPVNLQLTSMKFPATAIISILHRASGVILFFLIPFILWALAVSLKSAAGFQQLHAFLTTPVMKFILWGSLSALVYHFVAGLRHLLMDFGFAEGKQSGKVSAVITMSIAVIIIAVLGVLIW